MLNAKGNCDSARREYIRMREEKEINNRLGTAACFVYNEDDKNNKKEQSVFAFEAALKRQNSKPEVMSFPFVDNEAKTDNESAAEKNAQPGYTHRADLSIISAIVNMKVMARRKARSTRERMNRTLIPPNEYGNSQPTGLNNNSNSDVEDTEDDPWGYLRKCRYLRGVEDEKELSIKDIFN